MDCVGSGRDVVSHCFGDFLGDGSMGGRLVDLVEYLLKWFEFGL